jgi:hypothetical protein
MVRFPLTLLLLFSICLTFLLLLFFIVVYYLFNIFIVVIFFHLLSGYQRV